jgi:hypothetical protein
MNTLKDPYRFRVSEYRAIEETPQPYPSSAGYYDFIRSYTAWRKQYQDWWHSYHDFIRSYTDWCKHFQDWLDGYHDFIRRSSMDKKRPPNAGLT